MSTLPQTADIESKFRSQLLDRRARLESTIAAAGEATDLLQLLNEVDTALTRLESGSYGQCGVCHTAIADDDLLANPTAAYCLCELSVEQQNALSRDLDLAWHVQAALLPPVGLAAAGWESHFRYIPNGPVSGDYCDLIVGADAAVLYFMLGDVSGKGVAASLLMAHLNASLRSFARMGLTPRQILNEANRLLAESSLASHYATLVCGRALVSGEVEIVNAGHCAPMIVRSGGSVEAVNTSGLPLGLALPKASGQAYTAEKFYLNAGESIVLYTDGVTEAADADDREYGAERLSRILGRCHAADPREMVTNCLNDVSSFLNGRSLSDDLTVLALRRAKADG